MDARLAMFERFRRAMSLRADTLFRVISMERSYMGALVFNHGEETLDIKVRNLDITPNRFAVETCWPCAWALLSFVDCLGTGGSLCEEPGEAAAHWPAAVVRRGEVFRHRLLSACALGTGGVALQVAGRIRRFYGESAAIQPGWTCDLMGHHSQFHWLALRASNSRETILIFFCRIIQGRRRSISKEFWTKKKKNEAKEQYCRSRMVFHAFFLILKPNDCVEGFGASPFRLWVDVERG